MKYIRTKDGIYEITKQDIENHCLVIKVNENRHDLIHESLSIKQADTIEELCDLEVVIINNIPHILYKDGLSYYYKNDDKIELYGAIWTYKGLIYVAKTNDKGELELL